MEIGPGLSHLTIGSDLVVLREVRAKGMEEASRGSDGSQRCSNTGHIGGCPCAACRDDQSAQRKNMFSVGRGAISDFRFRENRRARLRPEVSSFHVLVILARARTGPVRVCASEIMRDKVRCLLEQVSS